MTAAEAPSRSFLRDYAETRRFLAGRPERVAFAPGGASVFFLRSPPRSSVQSLYELSLTSGEARELISPETLLRGAAETLSAEEKARLERQRVSARGITSYRVSEDGTQLLVVLSGKPYRYLRQSGKLLPIEVAGGTGQSVIDPQLSPDGKKLAFVQGHDLAVVELESGRRQPLTHGGHEALTRGLAEFVAQEEMGRFGGYVWSPDSKQLAFEEADLSGVERFVVPDLMHPERAPDGFRYPRPGRANAQVRVGVISASGSGRRWLHWDAVRYPYLATLKWPKGGPLLLVVQDRDQREEAVLAADPKTFATRVLWVEKDAAWLNLDQAFPFWLGGGRGFLWRTERNGGSELELHGPDGTLLESWLPPEHRLADWVGLDERAPANPWLYFTASPTSPESVLMRARPGGPPERLDAGRGQVWSAASLSRDGSLLSEVVTSSDAMPVTRVRRTEDSSWVELPSVAEAPDRLPQPEVLEVGGFWATVVRPEKLEKGRKLPVIVEVYGGPHHLSVKHAVRESLLSQWLADQGFLVVKLENRGTPHRGREWERAIQGDFSKIPLEDQMTALRAVAAKVPELDLERVGIEGWSFGGYMSALAVLKAPELFKAAVAGAPVVDWEDYDTHYTERYLGLPQKNPQGYRNSNLLTYAADLSRPLLLVHGTADDNVYFLHSLKLSNALFRAGKPHEFLPLSGLTHMVPEPEVTIRLWERIAQFFKESL